MANWLDLTDAFGDEFQIEEMRKKYENTFLIIKSKSGVEIPCVYKGFHNGQHYFTDANEVQLKLNHTTDREVCCKFPENGLFNTKKRMLYFTKLPLRQYRRGPCKDNVCISDPILDLWTSKNLFNFDKFFLAFNTNYPALATAIKSVRDMTTCSVAINRDFGVSLSFTKQSTLLYLFYHDTCIGNINSWNIITIYATAFEQEILDNQNLFEGFEVKFNGTK